MERLLSIATPELILAVRVVRPGANKSRRALVTLHHKLPISRKNESFGMRKE